MASPLARKHRCRTAVICHCLIPGRLIFYACCGYYCETCKGRYNGDLKDKEWISHRCLPNGG